MMDAKACKRKGGILDSKRKICKLPFEIKWDKRYRQISLDNELYPTKGIPRDFMILTPREIREVNRKTKERMAEYNRLKPKKWAGY